MALFLRRPLITITLALLSTTLHAQGIPSDTADAGITVTATFIQTVRVTSSNIVVITATGRPPPTLATIVQPSSSTSSSSVVEEAPVSSLSTVVVPPVEPSIEATLESALLSTSSTSVFVYPTEISPEVPPPPPPTAGFSTCPIDTTIEPVTEPETSASASSTTYSEAPQSSSTTPETTPEITSSSTVIPPVKTWYGIDEPWSSLSSKLEPEHWTTYWNSSSTTTATVPAGTGTGFVTAYRFTLLPPIPIRPPFSNNATRTRMFNITTSFNASTFYTRTYTTPTTLGGKESLIPSGVVSIQF